MPPSNFEFNVIITEPIQIITKTSANSGPPSAICIESEEPCKTLKIYLKMNYQLNYIKQIYLHSHKCA